MPQLPGLSFLKSYPKEELWRLFVDGSFWAKQEGWRGYESREAGSINAALESLCSSALDVEDDFELTVDFIKSIHRKCSRNVKGLEEIAPGEVRAGQVVYFAVPTERASIKGIEEFLGLGFLAEGGAAFNFIERTPSNPGPIPDRYIMNIPADRISEIAAETYKEMHKRGFNMASVGFHAPRQNEEAYLEAITESYNREIKAAQTIDEKIFVIAKHIRQYEVLHPFMDANGRTFANNLLNILLMQHGLPPATFYEPNVFDLYSAEELVEVIKEGMSNTLTIINSKEGDISLYGYRSSTADREQYTANLNSPSLRLIQQDIAPATPGQLAEAQALVSSSLQESHPLHHAAIYRHEAGELEQLITENPEKINLRIEQGAPPVYVGKTPLHLAIMMRNSAMLERLIYDHHVDLSVQDYSAKTVLHYAAESGDIELFKKVLHAVSLREDAVSILNSKDYQGKTPLHYAAESNDPRVAAILANTKQIQMNELDINGNSALTLAYKANKLETFYDLLTPEAAISEELIREIVRRKDHEAFERIVETVPSTLKDVKAFESAIMLANISIVEKFLNNGIDVNIVIDKGGATGLMRALQQGNADMVRYLLEKGASTTLISSVYGSCIDYLCFGFAANRDSLAAILLEADSDLANRPCKNNIPPIFRVLANFDFGVGRMLLDRGARGIDHLDDKGKNVLHYAMFSNDLSLINDLIQRNPGMLHQLNSDGQNPFHFALSGRSVRSLSEAEAIQLSEIVINAKVDLNAKDSNGRTILDWALEYNYYQLSAKLMQAGAQTNTLALEEFLKNTIINDPTAFTAQLMGQLSRDPLAAMGQLNDLYLSIVNNKVEIARPPKSQSSSLFGISFSFFKPSAQVSAQDTVLSLIKQLYNRMHTHALARADRHVAPTEAKSAYLELTRNHAISNEMRAPAVSAASSVIAGRS